MQQRVAAKNCEVLRFGRLRRQGLIYSNLTLVFLLASVSVPAQQQGSANGESSVPTMLLIMERAAPPASTLQEDLALRIKTTVREAINRSGRFQVHTFSAGDAVIKRALNEHLIAADDLAEPHKPESLQRIAHAIGSKFILKLGTVLDKAEVRTAVQYMASANPTDWLVLADEHMAVPFVLGKRRLRPDDIVNVTVDSITEKLGIPTHLAGALRQKPGTRVIGGTQASRQTTPDRQIAKTNPDGQLPANTAVAEPPGS